MYWGFLFLGRLFFHSMMTYLHFLKYSLLLITLVGCHVQQTDKGTLVFRHLESQRTGIDFENTIHENDTINLFDYYYIYNGAGLAVGDFNRDSLPDIFFAGNMVSSKLFLNKGDFVFQEVTREANVMTDSWIMGVNVVDINSDGWLDIYLNVAGPTYAYPHQENLLFVNQGVDDREVPIFKECAASYGINDISFSVQSAFLDVDRDGDLDLYVLTNQVDDIDKAAIYENGTAVTHGETIDHLYENVGWVDSLGHVYYRQLDKSCGINEEGYGLGLAVDDVNFDNWPDIYVANDFMPNDRLYINQQNGTFINQARDAMQHQSYNGMGVDIADINNDEQPDIIVLDMLPDNSDRRKSMIPKMKLHEFTMQIRAGYQAQYVRNTLQLNQGQDADGNLHFSELGQLMKVHATDWSWAPLFADFDNDGYRDLFVTNGFVKDMTDLDYINFGAHNSYFGTRESKENRKRKLIETLTEVKIPNVLFRNKEGVEFEDVSHSAGISIPSFSNGAMYADLDLDGDLDMVTNDINAQALVFENISSVEHNYLHIDLLYKGDNLNGIGTKIIVETDHFSSYSYVSPTKGYLSSMLGPIHVGLGKDTLIGKIKVIWPNGQTQMLSNISANQLLGITYDPNVVAKHTESMKSVKSSEKPIFQKVTGLISFKHKENEFNDYYSDPLLLRMYSRVGPCMSVGEMDHIIGKDIFIGGSHEYSPSIFLQDEKGTFFPGTFPPGEKQYEDAASLLFDFDGDNDLDLYIVSGGSEFEEGSPMYQDRMFINDGRGNFSKTDVLPPIHSSGSCIAGKDYDKDGDIDVFVGGRYEPGHYPFSPQSYLLAHTGDKFMDITNKVADLSEVGMVTSAIWSDYDNDGWTDLVLVGEWMPMTIFKNREGILEKQDIQSLIHSTGFWNVIKEGDLDRDGDMDYVVGNLGTNQDYQATEDKPFMLYAYDFDENGKVDPMFAQYMKDQVNGTYQLFPLHGRDDIVHQIIAYKKMFRTYDAFSHASMDKILTDRMVQQAHVYASHTFSSSVFVNNGDGTFQQIALPLEAQLAPINDLIVTDINEDGNMDVIAAGNQFHSEYTYGAHDASLGVCLLGDGQLNFQALSPDKVGLYLNKEVRSLSTMTTNDGKRLMIVGVNNSELITYYY